MAQSNYLNWLIAQRITAAALKKQCRNWNVVTSHLDDGGNLFTSGAWMGFK